MIKHLQTHTPKNIQKHNQNNSRQKNKYLGLMLTQEKNTTHELN